MAVFIVVFSGGDNDVMKVKINKVCESFNAKKFDVPKDDNTIQQRLA